MRYDAVIYDLDGTLLNTLDDLAAAVNHTMRLFGYAEHSTPDVCRMVGNGMEKLMRRALPGDVSPTRFSEALSAFKAYYADHSEDFTRPYEGIDEMLQTLHKAGVKQAVVSNKGDAFVKALCRKYFGDTITEAAGERADVRRKPYPDSVLGVMAVFGCAPERTLYVGDSDVDIITARNASIPCASVTWGFRPKEELQAAGAEMLIDSAEALGALILG